MGKGKVKKNNRKNQVSLNTLKGRKGWFFVSPFVIGFVLVMIGIYVDSVRYSVSTVQISNNQMQLLFAGLSNYKYVFTVDPTFIRTLTYSVRDMLMDIPTIIIFSLFIATILNQKMRGKTIFRAIFFIPVILATGVIERAQLNNVMMTSMSSVTGIETGAVSDTLAGGLIRAMDIQTYLQNLNFSPQVSEFILTLAGNIYSVINKSGVQILIFLAGLQSISPSIYEAAHIEGATGWESFWKITFPMISPMIFVNVVYSIIDSFTNTVNPIMGHIQRMGFSQGNYGVASAMAWIYFVVIAAFTIIISGIIYKFTFYQQRD